MHPVDIRKTWISPTPLQQFSKVALAVASIIVTSTTSSPVWAEQQPVNINQSPDASNADQQDAERIVILGSRRTDLRSDASSPVPVDILSAEDLNAQGNTDIIDTLTSVVPSLNATREPISDAATMVRPVNLRALPSDHTLVLVNGKRRHRGAVVGEFVSGVNRGAQGVDINPLFGAAIGQVEVLRDGAAAQYGSDAIAGVMNYSLLRDPDVRRINVQYSQAYEGDGETIETSGAFGFSPSSDGFVVLSFQVRDQKATSRGVQDGDGTTGGAFGLVNAGFPISDPAVIWGQPDVKDDYKFILNAGQPLNEDSELYAFGNYATRDVDGSFFYRNPATRSGVFVDGNSNVLFADTTGAGGCPVAPLPTDSLANAQAFINNAPDNCFAFFSQFPGGFTPRFGGKVEDYSFFTGIKGEFASSGLTYDVSVGFGENDLSYRINNTVNASLGPDSPTEFALGSQSQQEFLVNADFTYGVDVGFDSDLNIAFGLQYQDEEFEIGAGDEASYIAGPYISQGFSAGSNGFQGFSEDVAGTFTRDSVGTYLDLEADITENLLMSVAIRYEDFSDFGDTLDGKIAMMYQITDDFAVRTSYSSGFRAPTLGQSNLQRSSTGFSNGQLVEQLVIGSTDPIARFFGGGQLDAESANNFSIGFTANIGDLSLTLDYFDIKVKDRIALTSVNVTQADQDALVAQGILEAETISNVQFFVNDFDTDTRGIDVVASYALESDYGETQFSLAYNWNDTQVTNRGTTITDGREREIEDALPPSRATFTTIQRMDDITALIRINHYGRAFENLFNDESIPVETSAMFMVDAEVKWQVDDVYQVAVGAKNIFDEYPDEWRSGDSTGRTGGFLGAIYPLNHPAGFNGGSFYLRFTAEF